MIQDYRGKVMGGHSKRNIKSITKIVRHHSATSGGDIEAFQNGWKARGWRTGGYHEIILRDGTVQLCYDPDIMTNGVRSNNNYTYHICLVGSGNFTPVQEKVFAERALLAMDKFNLDVNDIVGHNEIPGTATACPGINMKMVRNQLREDLSVDKDDIKGHWAEKEINLAKKNGIMKGYPDGTFRPNQQVTRAELTVILNRLGLNK